MDASSNQEIQFPHRIAALLAAVTLLFVGWVVYTSISGYKALQRSSDYLVELEQRRGQIVHIDEVLTMSARMAAATGSLHWIERYETFEPKLDDAINMTLSLAQSPRISASVEATAAANGDLVSMERRAFTLVRQGQAGQAQQLLSSPAYEQLKQTYAQGMHRVMAEIEHALATTASARRQQLIMALLLALSFSLVVFGLLVLTVRQIHQWQTLLTQGNNRLLKAQAATGALNNSLEQRVQQRTQALQNTQKQLYSVLGNAPIVLYALDKNGVFTFCEGAALRYMGFQPGELIGTNAFDYPGADEKMLAPLNEAYAGKSSRTEVSFGERVFDSSHTPVHNDDGEVSSVIGVATDITDKAEAQSKWNSLTQAVAQHPAGIATVNLEGVIQYVNQSFGEIMGQNEAGLIGRNWYELRSRNTSRRQTNRLRDMVTAGHQWQGEFRHQRPDGSHRWLRSTLAPLRNSDGEVHQYLYMVEDISDQKKVRSRLNRQMYFDGLTGLPNRKLAMERIQTALARKEGARALMLIDIDNFKRVNDGIGHDMGDQLLSLVARRITGGTAPKDTVARVGGDEFLVLLAASQSRQEVNDCAQVIMAELARPYRVGNQELFITASLGIAIAPEHGQNSQSLFRNADSALHQAKAAGRNTCHFYNQETDDEAKRQIALEDALRSAIAADELSLNYQPIIDLKTGKPRHAEALIRWHSAQFGRVPPDQFIPLAERSDLILQIGDWVLREACRQSAAWRAQGQAELTIAINLSPRQFLANGFSEGVLDILRETGARPEDIELEITERLLVDDPESVKRKLRRLDEHGIKLCIDDFGTGYSSLAYLKHYPIDTLKIDRIFVRDVVHDTADADLAAGIITLAHSLSMRVTGEGVETAEQLAFLQRNGCDQVQGYYFSKPLSAEEFKAWVEKYAPEPATPAFAAP